MQTATVDIELRLLFEAIYAKYHYDFREYSYSPLKRRLGNALQHFGARNVSALQELVLHQPECFRRLLDYLTVPSSTMFRDPAVFQTLRSEVVPSLRERSAIKVWVAGCSTGEEVYSLAILLREEGLLHKTLIYATDINQRVLDIAEAGIYAEDRFAEFQTAYGESGGKRALSDYCTLAYGAVKFDSSLRSAILFSDHSLATDSVFAEVQLVTCRNVLIYFTRTLQDRAISLFHDSLAPGGFLCLGSRETLMFSSHVSHFRDVSAKDRIYQKP
jgi:chemotaxis protein methyltransferase CheR